MLIACTYLGKLVAISSSEVPGFAGVEFLLKPVCLNFNPAVSGEVIVLQWALNERNIQVNLKMNYKKTKSTIYNCVLMWQTDCLKKAL